VRALAPMPSAFTTLEGRVLKIHAATMAPTAPAGAPGRVLSSGPEGIVVATGAGALRLVEVQLEGRRRLPAAAFLAGRPLPPGTCLGAA